MVFDGYKPWVPIAGWDFSEDAICTKDALGRPYLRASLTEEERYIIFDIQPPRIAKVVEILWPIQNDTNEYRDNWAQITDLEILFNRASKAVAHVACGKFYTMG